MPDPEKIRRHRTHDGLTMTCPVCSAMRVRMLVSNVADALRASLAVLEGIEGIICGLGKLPELKKPKRHYHISDSDKRRRSEQLQEYWRKRRESGGQPPATRMRSN